MAAPRRFRTTRRERRDTLLWPNFVTTPLRGRSRTLDAERRDTLL